MQIKDDIDKIKNDIIKMKNNIIKRKNVIKYGILYGGLIWLYLLLESLGWINKPKIIHLCMMISISIILVIGFIRWIKVEYLDKENKGIDNDNKETIVGFIILAIGLIMRIGYTMYTAWNVRGHDVGGASVEYVGHASYIMHLFYGRLPDNNAYQFYHPPFYHFMSSITMHIVSFFNEIVRGEELIDAAKIVSCFASCGVLLQIKEFLKELDIKGRISNIILLIVAFCPNFYLMAGRVNNDSLVFFFMVVAIRYTYKWYYNQDWKSIIILALAYGFGMMTKISMGVLAIFTALFMIIVLVKNIKRHLYKKTIVQLLIFGLISLPLGLWFPIRNLILFKQPLNYVLEIEKNTPIYVGNISLLKRFLIHIKDIKELRLYNIPISDYNIPIYIWRGSLFGEFTLTADKLFEWILLIVNGVIIIVSIIAMIKVLISMKEKKELTYGLFFIWICQIVSYISFNLRYPFACTMDFRYIVTTVIVGAVFIGLFCSQIKDRKNKLCSVVWDSIEVMLLVYAISSIRIYLLVE